jgi:hypothetical protein
MTAEPLTPYPDVDGATSGWSGGASSRDRARRRDASGQTATLQSRVVSMVAATGRYGLTCGEVEAALAMGHGSVSGALSNVHKGGRLARLTERRNGQEIYVSPRYVDGRELAPYRPNRANRKTPRKRRPVVIHVPGQLELFPLPESP